MDFYGLFVKVLRVSDTVKAGYAGYHDYIAPS
ncbi:unknown [Bacteroides sp. CAG:709]|nr:unknown [Bacteroides sp. CAG:709]